MTDLAKIASEVMTAGLCSPRAARDPVNQPMINNWTEAMGDNNSRYVEWEAPPAMVQVWTMRGLHPASTPDDPLQIMSAALDDAGYTSVVATNCEQTYLRYLRLGEELTVRTRLESYSGPKKTALGEGWFFTTESTWFSGDEPVATMLFRVLKFKPGKAVAGKPIRPMVTRDTEFFWDGAAAGELRIQQCTECGVLRHPPGPMCASCGATKPGYVVASGTGIVYSYVIHHHPPVPGKQLPFAVALVELPEGVRVMAELREVDPATVHVGMAVQVGFLPVEDFVLPVWNPLGYTPPPPFPAPVSDLPELTFDVTPTFVVSTALATRDFQDVHHDRDLALSRGSRDIFLNILTTTGLVQRFVTDWAGPEAEVRRIAIKLGVPSYAYDKLTFTGLIKHQDGKDHVIEVTGRNSLGAHVTGRVEVTLP